MTCCPTCGAALEKDCKVNIDLNAGVVIGNGKIALLTRKETTVLGYLKEIYPRVATRNQILRRLYPIDADEVEIKIIDVFICHIRQKLKGLGMAIKTQWGEGYSISYEDK